MLITASRTCTRGTVLLCLVLLLTGCDGSQSALDPSGPAAREIAILWWIMLAVAAGILLLVVVLLLFPFLRAREKRWTPSPQRMIVIGGIIFPVVTLSILLPFGINVGSSMNAVLPEEALTIRINARQWWWEVEYLGPDSRPAFTTANEIYLPVGQPVELILNSADVIHSFWLPRLAGKRDLIPGQTNRLVIEAEEPGVYRGQCAEYCGESHALMSFFAVAVTSDEFGEWAANQQSPQPAETRSHHPGATLFRANGCGLCHAVRGHDSLGQTAPDLTHVGSRLTIAAGTLDNTPRNIALWLAHNNDVKPGNRMPEYEHLNLGDRLAIADYLESLK